LKSTIRRVVSGMVVAAGLGVMVTPSAAQVNVCPGDTDGDPGQEVVIPILIDNPFGISVFGLDLLFDGGVLAFDAVTKSALTEDWLLFNGSEIGEGVVRVGGLDVAAITVIQPDTLGYIHMMVRTGPPNSTYTFTNFEDDLSGAPDCDGEFSAVNPVAVGTWGSVKELFRSR
jgi:hypothetical protein